MRKSAYPKMPKVRKGMWIFECLRIRTKYFFFDSRVNLITFHTFSIIWWRLYYSSIWRFFLQYWHSIGVLFQEEGRREKINHFVGQPKCHPDETGKNWKYIFTYFKQKKYSHIFRFIEKGQREHFVQGLISRCGTVFFLEKCMNLYNFFRFFTMRGEGG